MDDEHLTSRLSSSRLLRVACLVAGSLALALGLVGVAVPLLPTTPFLILAAFCYARGSLRCYRWLVSNRLFGRYLNDYLCGRGVPWRVKTATLVLLWTVIICSVVFAVDHWWSRGLLLFIAVAVSAHVILLKGRRRDE